MNRYALMLCGLALVAPAPARADHPTGATRSDVRMLQDDLQNLDDTLATMDANDSRTAEFRRREQQIRDDVTRLRDEMQVHRQDRNEGFSASKERVDELRLRIRTLDEDVDRYSSRRFGSADRAVREGTRMVVRLDQPLSSRSSRLEDRVEATVDVPVRDASGRVAIPAGSRVSGTVTRVQRADRPLHGGQIDMVFDTVYVGNTRMDLRGRVVGLEDVNDDGNTTKRTGIGAALGGVLGGILGGTKGALLGIAVGGGGGFVSSKDDVEIPAGTIVTLELDRAVSARSRY
jgi:hypothetical protein